MSSVFGVSMPRRYWYAQEDANYSIYQADGRKCHWTRHCTMLTYLPLHVSERMEQQQLSSVSVYTRTNEE